MTSDEFGGRLPGEQGNILAENYIIKHFKDRGIKPYLGAEYRQKISYTSYPFEQQSHEMIIVTEDGESRSLEYGKDYYERNKVKNIEFETSDFVTIESESELGKVKKLGKPVFIQTENFFSSPIVGESSKSIIQVSKEVYNLIVNGEMKIKYKAEYIPEAVEVSNILGMIEGKDPSKVVVVSAHFDHVGKIGNGICRGALDNASGVTVLLETAKRIQELKTENQLETTVIFCGFNAEEGMLLGSKKFVESIKGKYDSVYNINIDTIGLKEGGRIFIDSDSHISEKLIKSVEEVLNNRGVEYAVDSEGMPSDQRSFSDASIQSLNIGQDGILREPPIIHTINDTNENIDYDMLESAVGWVLEIVKKNDAEAFTNEIKSKKITKDFSSEDLTQIREKMLEKRKEYKDILEYHQYVQFNIDDAHVEISGNRKLQNQEDIKMYYEDVVIPEKISGFDFESAMFYNDHHSREHMRFYGTYAFDSEYDVILKRDVQYTPNMLISLDYLLGDKKMRVMIESIANQNEGISEINTDFYTKESFDNEKGELFFLKEEDAYKGAYYEFDKEKKAYRFMITFFGENDFSKDEIRKIIDELDFDQLIEQVGL